MNWSISTWIPSGSRVARWGSGRTSLLRLSCLGALAGIMLWAESASAQVVTIDKNGNVINSTGRAGATVDRRYRQITPTDIPLPKNALDAKTRLDLERFLEADQGFAMRPFPRGHKGLTLVANGEMIPAGEDYLSMVTANGMSAKPGDRLVLTDVKIDKRNIVFQINGGPDLKHRFLRHIEIGTGPMTSPVVQDTGDQATGARLTLVFPHGVPDLTGKQVEALLAPLISFEVKTPIEAFTDTLPPKLKQAILDHHVLVGMSTDMVLFALGRPHDKVREMDGQMPVEIWIYGKPPQDVDFVRINGNRVIRVEIAAVGKPLQIFTKDEVEGMMRTDGTPLEPQETAHNVELGDVQRNPDTQAPAAPPTLRNPGEKLPTDDTKSDRVGVMRPVHFPTQKPDDDDSTDATSGSTTTANAGKPAAKPAAQTPASQTPAPATTQPAQPASGSQTAPTKPAQPAPDGTQQQ
ncbi:MAG TPA: hypothetical protein VMU48_17670 [Terracidiphilus sp.]|nr:hypothetical protein [Terracidiphilus sp.]